MLRLYEPTNRWFGDRLFVFVWRIHQSWSAWTNGNRSIRYVRILFCNIDHFILLYQKKKQKIIILVSSAFSGKCIGIRRLDLWRHECKSIEVIRRGKKLRPFFLSWLIWANFLLSLQKRRTWLIPGLIVSVFSIVLLLLNLLIIPLLGTAYREETLSYMNKLFQYVDEDPIDDSTLSAILLTAWAIVAISAGLFNLFNFYIEILVLLNCNIFFFSYICGVFFFSIVVAVNLLVVHWHFMAVMFSLYHSMKEEECFQPSAAPYSFAEMGEMKKGPPPPPY